MRRELLNRVRRLEQLSQINQSLILTFAEGRQPERMSGSARHFFRLMGFLCDNDEFRTERTSRAVVAAEADLNALRSATGVEGPAAQLFELAKALALGPVKNNPQPNIEEKSHD